MARIRVDRLRELADVIEEVPEFKEIRAEGVTSWPGSTPPGYFNMDVVLSDFVMMGGICGSVGCIAGWAAAIYGDLDKTGKWTVMNQALDVLGLNQAQGDALFLSYGTHRQVDELTKEDAVLALRRLADGVPAGRLWREVDDSSGS